MAVPENPKIYHILHVDRLQSVLSDGCLWADSRMMGREDVGSMIGMNHIKQRRLNDNMLSSHFGLMVGDCVPFYFCPRSVMLFVITHGSEDLNYAGGQGPIIHLESDLKRAVEWADSKKKRWAFSLSNAGSFYFEDRRDLSCLNEIDWQAVSARRWSGEGIPKSIKEGKQAEFLVEDQFPWGLVERVGVFSNEIGQRVYALMKGVDHRPKVEIRTDWYY